MTKETDFIRVIVSRQKTKKPVIREIKVVHQETKEPVFQEVKVVYPEGYKPQNLGYSKAPKTDWWKT